MAVNVLMNVKNVMRAFVMR